MSDLNLDNLKLSESSAPAYPEIRLRAACQEWGVQQSLELAKAGVGSAVNWWGAELSMMHGAERQACEKVFGMLISRGGPLRSQAGLRAQLVNELQRNAALWYHGARLFQLMVQGLPFIPLPPETRTIALRELNRYKSLSLRSDAPLNEVQTYLKRFLRHLVTRFSVHVD